MENTSFQRFLRIASGIMDMESRGYWIQVLFKTATRCAESCPIMFPHVICQIIWARQPVKGTTALQWQDSLFPGQNSAALNSFFFFLIKKWKQNSKTIGLYGVSFGKLVLLTPLWGQPVPSPAASQCCCTDRREVEFLTSENCRKHSLGRGGCCPMKAS